MGNTKLCCIFNNKQPFSSLLNNNPVSEQLSQNISESENIKNEQYIQPNNQQNQPQQDVKNQVDEIVYCITHDVINENQIRINDNSEGMIIQSDNNYDCDNAFLYQNEQNKKLNQITINHDVYIKEQEQHHERLSICEKLKINCLKCNKIIENESIQLCCCHSYDYKCFEELIYNQIFNQRTGILQCICTTKISVKSTLLLLFSHNEIKYNLFINEIYNNQLIIIQQKLNFKKCQNENCFFIYNQQKIDQNQTIYCPICLSIFQNKSINIE